MEDKNQRIESILNSLSHSKFRSQFSLKEADLQYIEKKGIEKVKEHASDFIEKRLASAVLLNDGKQTPMKGHPVFIAQHATATCCRGCLLKWHKIPANIELTKSHKEYIVNVIMIWIQKQMKERREN